MYKTKFLQIFVLLIGLTSAWVVSAQTEILYPPSWLVVSSFLPGLHMSFEHQQSTKHPQDWVWKTARDYTVLGWRFTATSVAQSMYNARPPFPTTPLQPVLIARPGHGRSTTTFLTAHFDSDEWYIRLFVEAPGVWGVYGTGFKKQSED